VKPRWWESGVPRQSIDIDTDRRMYSAGYRTGQRLAHVGPLSRHTDTMTSSDPHLILLGANSYAHGFVDGWKGSVPDWAPLALSDMDNHFMGARP
jgi:hypothetical protein